MTRTNDGRRPRRGYPPPQLDDHPLLRVLIAEATRRGDTLAALAGALGVTYERVAQWRRKEANVSKASRCVIESAAKYLGIPTVMVLCLTGSSCFVWSESLASKTCFLQVGAHWTRM